MRKETQSAQPRKRRLENFIERWSDRRESTAPSAAPEFSTAPSELPASVGPVHAIDDPVTRVTRKP
jgi:hypothetical protein